MDDLLQVLTVAEVCHLWYFVPETVRQAITTRHQPLVARKSGRTWLISYASCVKRWGEPPTKPVVH